jgi:hypothetical protein
MKIKITITYEYEGDEIDREKILETERQSWINSEINIEDIEISQQQGDPTCKVEWDFIE